MAVRQQRDYNIRAILITFSVRHEDKVHYNNGKREVGHPNALRTAALPTVDMSGHGRWPNNSFEQELMTQTSDDGIL